MGEEISETMNLDLNLGPIPEPEPASGSSEAVTLDEWMEEPIHGPDPEPVVTGLIRHRPVSLDEWMENGPISRIREAMRLNARARQRWRWRQVQISPEAQNISMELNQVMVNSGNANTLQAGEGSVATGERSNEVPKTCENSNGILEEETSENKDDIEKRTGCDGSFFDCNICLDLAREPVVTCCGHLFCWPCLYRWIHVHSDAKECPVCKGEVTLKNVTPIYGRGKHMSEPDEDSSLKIPVRPQARRVESVRQAITRNPFTFPVEEMIRRLGSRFDLSRDLNHTQEPESARETNSLLNRILTSRGRREQNPMAATDVAVDLMQSSVASAEAGENRRQSMLLRRTLSHRQTIHSLTPALNSTERMVDRLTPAVNSTERMVERPTPALNSTERMVERMVERLTPTLNSTERMVERMVDSYFRNNTTGRNQEQAPQVDDRDSFSSIAAVINSESQMDTAVEIDSVSLSTSSSRRRNDASRISDIDSGDSRALRRRRLN